MQVIVLFAGINDIIHGWTINTVIFPKACKEYYSLLSTFLWVINEDNSCDVASDVGVNLCNVKSCLNTSNNEIFTNKRGDLPCINISKHTCPVVKWSDEKFVLVYIYLSF